MPWYEVHPDTVAIVNKGFMWGDLGAALLTLTLSFILSNNPCATLSCLAYTLFYIGQTLQHNLLLIFPHIDINSHHLLYKRAIIAIGIINSSYLFMALTYWQRTNSHPLFCALGGQGVYMVAMGVAMMGHVVFALGWFVTLVQGYINRRYYLLALGGFQVEQRMLEQRLRTQTQPQTYEPDLHPYIFDRRNKNYYKFEDVVEGEDTCYCSICLGGGGGGDDHFVDAGCGHSYHKLCLMQWAQVNENCPQCRYRFEGVPSGDKQQIHVVEELQEQWEQEEQQEQQQQQQQQQSQKQQLEEQGGLQRCLELSQYVRNGLGEDIGHDRHLDEDDKDSKSRQQTDEAQTPWTPSAPEVQQ